jgi:hypothetical protein
MAVTIPPNQDVVVLVQWPSGTTDWPGPPIWTPSDPEAATIALVDGSNQLRAVLHTSGPVTVTVTCLGLNGTLDILTDDQAQAPTDALPLVLA